ncbi:MAG: threonine/serine exporter family protein [Acidobacteriota bacterium]
MRRSKHRVPTPSNPSPVRSYEIELLMRLARALHTYGSPAHILEEALERVAEKLGQTAQFFATPTSVFAAFGVGADQRLVLERLSPGRLNLEKLSQLDELLDGLLLDRVSPGSAGSRLRAIVEAPRRYGEWISTLAFGAASGAAARFFGGSWWEMLAAGTVGLVLGAMAVLADRHPTTGRLYDFGAAASASALAACGAIFTGQVSFFVVVLAGLIVLLPGLTLTVAMRELATGNLVSGSSRLAGTVVLFVTMAFGVALGNGAVEAVLGAVPTVLPAPMPWWSDPLALVISALGLTVIFRARPRDFPWLLLAGVLALYSGREGARLFGPELGALQAALVVGLASNLFARLRHRPAGVMQLPGLLMLVPGSIGFRGMSMLVDRDTVGGIQSAFSMVLVATAIVTGLLLANALLPPKRTL